MRCSTTESHFVTARRSPLHSCGSCPARWLCISKHAFALRSLFGKKLVPHCLWPVPLGMGCRRGSTCTQSTGVCRSIHSFRVYVSSVGKIAMLPSPCRRGMSARVRSSPRNIARLLVQLTGFLFDSCFAKGLVLLGVSLSEVLPLDSRFRICPRGRR